MVEQRRMLGFSVSVARNMPIGATSYFVQLSEAERITYFLGSRAHADSNQQLRTMQLFDIGEAVRQTIDYFTLVTAEKICDDVTKIV